MTRKQITTRLENIPALWQGFWAFQILSGNRITVQQYLKDGRKREFFGHTFQVDFDAETLTPIF